jgi:hypothetical protein
VKVKELELERIFMKIKRSTNHHEKWEEEDRNLKTVMSKKREKVHNR